ncbi:MAG: phage scaffolding protein, partial [Phycisphaerae bacterium]|nr:phage scaffolding protein [Phycisphaerae bacterium]
MAMTPDSDLERVLDRPAARRAGVVCAGVAVLAAAAVVALMVVWPQHDPVLLTHLGAWAALWALIAVAAVRLALGSASAQRLLLVFWLLVGVVTAICALAGQVRGAAWWTLPVPLGAVLAAMLTGAVVCVALLVAASADRSPLRYASYVTVSIAVAVALAITVNLIAQDIYLHRDMQQLGRYGLSERTRKIVATLQTPARVTCVYTSSDEAMRGSDFGPAVAELLTDMHEQNARIEVASAATESAKAAVVARLRGQAGGQADKHVQFLTDFARRSKELVESLTAEQARWSGLGEESYLAMWALTAQVPAGLVQGTQQADSLRAKVAAELAGAGLPDYAGLTDEVTKTLSGLKRDLSDEARVLAGIAKIPQAAAANRKGATAKLDAMRQAVAELNKSLAGDKAQNASAALLDQVAAQARDATTKALAAAKALANAGGAENARYVAVSRYYQLSIPTGVFEVRADLGRFIEQYVAGSLQGMAETVEAVRKVAKPEYYGSSAAKLQAEAAELDKLVEQVTSAGKTALNKLAEVDEPTRPVLQLAQAGQMFQGPLEIAEGLLKEAELLPKLTANTLAADIMGDNIVIVEAAGKTAVVPFDEVWPLRAQRWAGGEAEQGPPPQRTFQGDSAIGSRLLAMTSEPFATVVLTYFGGSGQTARMVPRADIGPEELTALRKRLGEANFQVLEWNLSEPRPAETPGRPQVLLVLPPPPALPAAWGGEAPAFGPEHLAKVAAAIDTGTPAIFLTQFLWPRQLPFMPPLSPTYGFAEYLRTTWGIDVRCNFLVIPAVADETQPGLYRLAPARFSFVPLSAFTSHPIGRPLQAQRVLWTALAPILPAEKLPPGVSVEPVLQVPSDWQSTWATERLVDLQTQLETQNAAIRPDYAAGDLATPFAVAVAATRSGRSPPAGATTTTTAAAPSHVEGMPSSAPAA